MMHLGVKKHCEGLNNKEKQEFYRKILQEAKDASESDDINQLKKLSEVAVIVEEMSTKELFKPFYDENPLRLASIKVENGDFTNYLFSLGDSSKLYDLRENQEEALYRAIKSDNVELVKHLLIVLLPDNLEEIRKADLKQLKEVLSKSYEELKENISQDMKNYLEKQIKFYSFLCGFEFNKDPIELFVSRSEPDYQIDKLLLFLILEKTKETSEINNLIELLKKYERFDELEYKIRILKSELERGGSRYSPGTIKASIKDREEEMKEIDEKYIRLTDLAVERKRLVKKLCFKNS